MEKIEKVKRTNDSTNGLLSEKYGFKNFWRLNEKRMKKNEAWGRKKKKKKKKKDTNSRYYSTFEIDISIPHSLKN